MSPRAWSDRYEDEPRPVDYEHLEIAPLTDQERRAWLGRQYANDTPHPITVIAVGLALAALLLAIVSAAVLIAAPRSGQTTAAPDYQGGSTAGAGDPAQTSAGSSAGQSGAPHERDAGSATRAASAPTRHDCGAPTPSPAVALEATSGGLFVPTTPMPATTS